MSYLPMKCRIGSGEMDRVAQHSEAQHLDRLKLVPHIGCARATVSACTVSNTHKVNGLVSKMHKFRNEGLISLQQSCLPHGSLISCYVTILSINSDSTEEQLQRNLSQRQVLF